MAHSLLMIPVPELEPVIRPRLLRRAPAEVSADPADVVAHITLLGPFAPREDVDEGLLAELADFFADVLPFHYRLDRVAQFPGGPVYLAPEPAGPFRRLTQGLHGRFPEFPPYGGRFDDVVPHLTVPTLPGEDLTEVRAELSGVLPAAAYAREAVLYWWAAGESRGLADFPFGVRAA